jgi:tRNA(Arg) A34 adenosine deaminase TadA
MYYERLFGEEKNTLTQKQPHAHQVIVAIFEFAFLESNTLFEKPFLM